MYCSNRCQRDKEYKNYLERWKLGYEPGFNGATKNLSRFIRRYLLEKYNNTCQICGWNKRHPVDDRVLVEIDHVDGDSENCKEENLMVLCPNCHSMTPTFRARNKGSKRRR